MVDQIIEMQHLKFEEYNTFIHKHPVVISIPHSGIWIPPEMKTKLKKDLILPNSDWYLPDFYDFLRKQQYTVLINPVNRYVIDVNRDRIREGDSYKTNLIYTHTTQDDKMYEVLPNDEEIQERIDNFYLPYHQRLEQLLAEKKKHFPKVYLLDLHSFGLNFGADILLGSSFGTSCSDEFLKKMEQLCSDQGFSVKCNQEYAGGYITRHYGRQGLGYEALQIELWYGAYIEKREFGKEELPGIQGEFYKDARERMGRVFESLRKCIR